MVDGVMHNACLRLEASGDSLDDLIRSRGRRRWFGRGGLAVGGAASLAVGAVLGGALEGVPVLLPPPASASAAPQVVHGTPDGAGGMQPTAFDSVASAAQAAASALAGVSGASSGGASGAAAGAVSSGAGAVSSTPATSGIVQLTSGALASNPAAAGGQASGPLAPLPGAPSPAPIPSPSNSVGQALGTVSQVASQLPVVGSTLSGLASSAGTALGGLTSTLGSGASGVSSSSPLSGVTNAVSGVVGCVTGVVGGSTKSCSSATSLLGNL